jgi:hypothetical protein
VCHVSARDRKVRLRHPGKIVGCIGEGGPQCLMVQGLNFYDRQFCEASDILYVSSSTVSTRLRAQQKGVNGGRYSLPPTFHLLVAKVICIGKIVVRPAPEFMETLKRLKRCRICEVIDFFVS